MGREYIPIWEYVKQKKRSAVDNKVNRFICYGLAEAEPEAGDGDLVGNEDWKALMPGDDAGRTTGSSSAGLVVQQRRFTRDGRRQLRRSRGPGKRGVHVPSGQ